MVDNRLREDERKQEAHAFLTADAAELDEGFSRRFRQIVTAAHEILPNGHMHCVVDGVSATKVMNIEVEDAFARAAAMRRCGAGASSPLPCVMFGAVALTLQCSNLYCCLLLFLLLFLFLLSFLAASCTGRRYGQASSASKHILAELKSLHAKQFQKRPVPTSQKKRVSAAPKIETICKHDFSLLREEDPCMVLNLPASGQSSQISLPPLQDGDSVVWIQQDADCPEWLQNALQLDSSVNSIVAGGTCSGLQSVTTVGEETGANFVDDATKPSKKSSFNGWTLHRSQVLAAHPRLPGESAAARMNRALNIAKDQWQARLKNKCCFGNHESCDASCQDAHGRKLAVI